MSFSKLIIINYSNNNKKKIFNVGTILIDLGAILLNVGAILTEAT
jgi:hypothetical protein